MGTQPSAHLVAHDGPTHRAPDNDTCARLVLRRRHQGVYDEGRPAAAATPADNVTELRTASDPGIGRQHVRRRSAGSDRDVVTALGAARVEDRATGPRPHAQPEAVHLGATAVVRLKGALAHWGTPGTTSATPDGAATKTLSRYGRVHVRSNARRSRLPCARSGVRAVFPPTFGQSPGSLAGIVVALLTFRPPSPIPSRRCGALLTVRPHRAVVSPSVHRLWMTVWMTR